jgi:PPM family protein phosphatase
VNGYLRFSGFSHRGYERDNNEDATYAGRRLLALADGMGGHAAGEVASSLVIAEIAPLDDLEGSFDIGEALKRAAEAADRALARHVQEHPEHAGMGTTLTALLFAEAQAALVHIGDSRAYRLRRGDLKQLTHDDTLVQGLVDRGLLTTEEARRHPQRSVVLKVLTGRPIEPTLQMLEVELDDRYMICSDGVSDVLTDTEIHEHLSGGDPQLCAGDLVNAAMRVGSHDNVSCIVADVIAKDLGFDIPMIGGAALDASRSR